MRLCRGSQQRVNDRKRIARIQAAPDLRDAFINGKNPFPKRVQYFVEPALQSGSLLRIARSQPFDSLTDFTDDQNAKKQILLTRGIKPCGDARITTRALSYLGDHVCIDQVHSKSTIRPISRDRVISTPSSGADASNALKLLPPVRRC